MKSRTILKYQYDEIGTFLCNTYIEKNHLKDLNENFKEVKYEDTEIYSLYKMYLDRPDEMQERLFD